ncbi:MAG: SUMF1/EgtB/PvdO family nonheme iron enzyme, partial [Magnetococcales bacterium]|nr:SUMF1/EgtB/PvdO family nonheme iron enzyme [Magnetococcales bacterium]
RKHPNQSSPIVTPRMRQQGSQLPDQEPRYLRQRHQRRRIFFTAMALLLLWLSWDSMVEWLQRQSTPQSVEPVVIPPAFRQEADLPKTNLPFYDPEPAPVKEVAQQAETMPVAVTPTPPAVVPTAPQQPAQPAVQEIKPAVAEPPLPAAPAEPVPIGATQAVPWQKCLIKTSAAARPQLMAIDKGDYGPKNLKKEAGTTETALFLKAMALERVTIKEPFLIQTHEVTQTEFQEFVQAVQQWPDGPDKQEIQLHIGLASRWLQIDPAQPQLRSVSWEAAQDYVLWLNRTTGCTYHLPSREQWAAAVMATHGKTAERATWHSLLRGVREWSITRCPGGYALLGEEESVSTSDIGRSSCMPAMIPMAGFRVVLEPPMSQQGR